MNITGYKIQQSIKDPGGRVGHQAHTDGEIKKMRTDTNTASPML